MSLSWKSPAESATVTYATVSGRGAARITACPRGRCSTHSSAVPAIVAVGTAGPVENTISFVRLVALRRRSMMPGRSSRWYTRLGFQPSLGFTWIALRCHDTFTPPATGDSTTWRARPLMAPVPPPRPPPPPPPPPPAISSITSSNWMTASSLSAGTTAPDSGIVRTTCGGVVSGGPPVARPGWRKRRSRPTPRRSGAAERLELVGQCLPLVAPRPLLFALLGDHLGGGPRDEVLVGELGGEAGQLLLQPRQFARQAPALLPHVDRVGERHEHFAPVGKHGMRAGTPEPTVEIQVGELRQTDDSLPFPLEGGSDQVRSRLDRRR